MGKENNCERVTVKVKSKKTFFYDSTKPERKEIFAIDKKNQEKKLMCNFTKLTNYVKCGIILLNCEFI